MQWHLTYFHVPTNDFCHRIYRRAVVSHFIPAKLPGVEQGTSGAQRCLVRVTREGGERRRGGTCHPLDFPLSVGVIHGGFFMGDALQPIIPASVILGSSKNSFISC
ncbi:hypothetical protein Bbelb_406150 [Branchiostoma belcheri]|nr:hypothetical protein Bbelb_406150 [Branchiostoma belcheri]